LERAEEPAAVWHALWEALFHQGHVGVGSYAAVPHLVRIHRTRGKPDWNTYALVASIELARGRGGNPQIPEWARDAYVDALSDLATLGLRELREASDRETVRSILGLLAMTHGEITYARVLIELSEDEVIELLEQAGKHQ
jgi:hypothetical protein